MSPDNFTRRSALRSIGALAASGVFGTGIAAAGGPAESGDSSPADRLTNAAIPLQTTDPADPIRDLGCLGESLGDARVVGLGEATHGTREFQQVKDRLIRHLVTNGDVRAIAFESNFAAGLRIDDYVTGDDVDPVALLDDISAWLYNTESVLALITWLRWYNERCATRGREKEQVRVFGVDIQRPHQPARRLRQYLSDVDPEALGVVGDALETLEQEGLGSPQSGRSEERISLLGEVVASLEERMSTHRDRYIAAGSRERWELARRCVWTLEKLHEQATLFAEGKRWEAFALRDELMAQQAEWIEDFIESDGLAVWAHNDHVIDGTHPRGYARTGRYLRERYGANYLPLALEFDTGSFRAHDLGSDPVELDTIELESIPENSVTQLLREVDHDVYALPFGALDEAQAAATFDREYGIHAIGSGYNPAIGPEVYHRPRDLTAEFDGLIFVGESTPTQLLDPANPPAADWKEHGRGPNNRGAAMCRGQPDRSDPPRGKGQSKGEGPRGALRGGR